MAIIYGGRFAEDVAIIKAPADWMEPILNVRRHNPVELAAGRPKYGVIRSFDLTSVFTADRKMEHFPSIEDLVQTWEVMGPRRYR